MVVGDGFGGLGEGCLVEESETVPYELEDLGGGDSLGGLKLVCCVISA